MKRVITAASLLALGALLIVPAQGQDPGVGEAVRLARKLTEEGAATFNTADAKAMASYYTEDAKVFLQTRSKDGFAVRVYDGREAIERLYTGVFKDPTTIHSKNTVEYAKLLTSDVLVIAGTFEPNHYAARPLKVPFYQVRVKRGDKWLIDSLRIFVVPEKEGGARRT
jgi:ketosteroid isomerase-like protein